MTEAQFSSIGDAPPPTIIWSTPSQTTIWTDDLDNASVRKKRPRYWGIIIFALVLVLAIVATAIVVPLLFWIGKTTITTNMVSMSPTTFNSTLPSTNTITTHTKITTTSTAMNSSTSTTTSTKITTTDTAMSNSTSTPTSTKTATEDAYTSMITQTTATPIIVCSPPYAITPNNTCVNILVDFDNCGTVGYVCPSNYTSCSVGACSSAPPVQLSNSTYIWTASINGSVDDKYFGTHLPFNVTLYSTTTDYISVTTNGVLCLGSCSTAYTESTLPTGTFGGATVFGFWDDLYIYSGTSQGIYQATQGDAPNRTLVFEYYCSHYHLPNEYYHFQILFFEQQPGVVQMIYFDASDGGVTCTIGVQGSRGGASMMYSYDTAGAVTQNMTLTFDTNAGTYTNATIG